METFDLSASAPSTRRLSLDDFRAHASQVIASYIQWAVGDVERLNRIVADGASAWRNRFRADLRGWPVDDAMAEQAWRFLCDQQALRHPEMAAGKVLDALEVNERRPPTEKEIADGWEVESASSDEGRRALYGPGGHPKELLDRLRRGDD